MEINRKIPEEIALVSFDNLKFTEATSPPLTTLEQVTDKIGKIATKIILDLILNEESAPSNEEIRIKAGLCIRGSCGFRKTNSLI